MRTNVKFDSADLWEKDRRHAVHGWTDISTFRDTGSEILVEADGVHVWDVDGNRLMDGMGGVWCVNIGYGREEMVESISDQARCLAYANPFRSTTTPPAAELTAKIAQLAPEHLNHVHFSGGGSTANDSALRLVQLYFNHLGLPNKKQIICRRDAYHGSTSATASLSGIPFNKIGFDTPDIGVHYVSAPYSYRRPDGMSPEDFCDQLVNEFRDTVAEIGPEHLACFFAEPIMGMGGVLEPPPGYFRRIAEICKENEILVIADEVVTAFGRLGHFFASNEVFEMSPDIISCAKGLTSGYLPLGATIISDSIIEPLRTPIQEGAIFSHGFTYAEHPVCCAAALKNIEIIEREELCQHVQETEPYFRDRLASLMDLAVVGDVRGRGFMWGIESVADKETKELLPLDARVGERVSRHARDLGLIVRPLGHLNVLSPPLTMTRADIDFLAEVLYESVSKTQDDLVREGIWKG